MLDKIQFLLSLQIIGFCIFGGATLLLRAGDNRAKRILGWGMFLWAFLAAIRLSVNLYLHKPKEAFHPDILIMGALVTATLACYVIEVLRPGFLTCKRFFLFISPVVFGGLAYLTYRLSGGEIHTYYSIREVFEYLNMDVLLRMTVFLLTLFYMILPVYLIARYSKDFNVFLAENVSDPEEYDLEWLRKRRRAKHEKQDTDISCPQPVVLLLLLHFGRPLPGGRTPAYHRYARKAELGGYRQR